MEFPGPLTSIPIGGNAAWILVRLCGPVVITPAVVIRSGLDTFPATQAPLIWGGPLAGGTGDLCGSCNRYYSARVLPWIVDLVRNATLNSGDTYL